MHSHSISLPHQTVNVAYQHKAKAPSRAYQMGSSPQACQQTSAQTFGQGGFLKKATMILLLLLSSAGWSQAQKKHQLTQLNSEGEIVTREIRGMNPMPKDTFLNDWFTFRNQDLSHEGNLFYTNQQDSLSGFINTPVFWEEAHTRWKNSLVIGRARFRYPFEGRKKPSTKAP